jgi:hypothetical protein
MYILHYFFVSPDIDKTIHIYNNVLHFSLKQIFCDIDSWRRKNMFIGKNKAARRRPRNASRYSVKFPGKYPVTELPDTQNQATPKKPTK